MKNKEQAKKCESWKFKLLGNFLECSYKTKRL